jgi:imidazolonepropionase-like amidohydrolase
MTNGAFVALLTSLSCGAGLLAPLAVVAPAAISQRLAVPATLIFEHANVIDGRSNRPRTNMSVVVKDGKITEVGPAASPIAPGATVIDLKGAWMMPGFIDAHVHFGDVAAARTALLTGSTTVRTMHVEHFLDVEIREAHRRGDETLPDVFVAGYQIRPDMFPEFFEDFPALGDMKARVSGTDNIRRVVRAMASRRVDHIKFLATERAGTAETDPRQRTFSDEEIAALVDEARRLGLSAAAHAHGDEGARAAVMAGVRTLEHGTWVGDTTFKAMKARRTCYVPTFTGGSQPPARPQDRDNPILAERRRIGIPLRNKLVARAEAEGLLLAAGTDLRYTTGELSIADEALSFQRAGVSQMRALQIMTVGSATCLGIQDRTGAIAPGLEADLVVLNRSPLIDLEALKDISMIVNDGKVAFRRRGD